MMLVYVMLCHFFPSGDPQAAALEDAEREAAESSKKLEEPAS